MPTPRKGMQPGADQHDHAVEAGQETEQEGGEAATRHRQGIDSGVLEVSRDAMIKDRPRPKPWDSVDALVDNGLSSADGVVKRSMDKLVEGRR
jgi:hypothetical protein